MERKFWKINMHVGFPDNRKGKGNTLLTQRNLVKTVLTLLCMFLLTNILQHNNLL